MFTDFLAQAKKRRRELHEKTAALLNIVSTRCLWNSLICTLVGRERVNVLCVCFIGVKGRG